jgi:hypothetical protein
VRAVKGEVPDRCNIFSLFDQSLTSYKESTWCDQSFQTDHKIMFCCNHILLLLVVYGLESAESFPAWNKAVAYVIFE